MRRTLFAIFLVVLCLFSFTSCGEEDRSEEVIQDFIHFKKIISLAPRMENLFSEAVKTVTEEGVTLNGEIADGAYLANQIVLVIENFDNDHYISSVSGKLPQAKGKISGNSKLSTNPDLNYDEYSLTFENVEVTCWYQDEDENGTAGEVQEEKMTINGTIEYKAPSEKAQTYKCDLTINGVGYVYTFTCNETERSYTEASVDGRTVDVRMLNAYIDYFI